MLVDIFQTKTYTKLKFMSNFKQLRNYLEMQKKAGTIIKEHEQLNALTKKSRVKLMNLLAELIEEDYGDAATPTEIKSICQATITLFPSLKDETGGIVSSSVFFCVSFVNFS